MGKGQSALEKQINADRDARDGLFRERDYLNSEADRINNRANDFINDVYNNNNGLIKQYTNAEEKYKRDERDKMIEVDNNTTIKNTANISSLNSFYNYYTSNKNDYFNKKNTSIKGTFGILINKTKEQIDNLISDVTNQNQYIASQIQENKANENHSKKVKSEFQKKEIEILKKQNEIIWYVFYLLVLILGGVMWYYDTVNMFLQFVIFHVLLVYPFLIYYLELFLYVIYSYSRAFFESTPFNQVYLGNG